MSWSHCCACSLFQRKTRVSLSSDPQQEDVCCFNSLHSTSLRTGNPRGKKKKKGWGFFSLSLITACKAVFGPWYYNHIHCRTILENNRDCLFNTTIMCKWVYVTHSEHMLCCILVSCQCNPIIMNQTEDLTDCFSHILLTAPTVHCNIHNVPFVTRTNSNRWFFFSEQLSVSRCNIKVVLSILLWLTNLLGSLCNICDIIADC